LRGTAVYRPWRSSSEKYWLGYLDGAPTFDEAIGKIVEAALKPR
jgi:hypothetical protein